MTGWSPVWGGYFACEPPFGPKDLMVMLKAMEIRSPGP
jgi:hypothetical protein